LQTFHISLQNERAKETLMNFLIRPQTRLETSLQLCFECDGRLRVCMGARNVFDREQPPEEMAFDDDMGWRGAQDDDTFDVVPGSELIVGRTAHRNNQSDYYLDGHKRQQKEVVARLLLEGIDLDNNRFLILQACTWDLPGSS
jgi:hypothetical protein